MSAHAELLAGPPPRAVPALRSAIRMRLANLLCGAALAAFSGVLLAQVGSGLSYFLWNARYADLERAADADYARRTQPGVWPLGLLCYAHWKVKRYAKLFDCADRLEMQIKAGHRTMEHEDAPLIASDVSALPQLLRANAWLELGEYGQALAEAKRAIAAIPDASAFSYFSLARYQIETLSVAAIASHLLGDDTASDKYLKQLEDLRIGWPNSDTLPNLREYQVARIYMMRGDYAKALGHVSFTEGKGTLALQNLFTARERDDDLSDTFEIGRQFMIAKSLLEAGQRDKAKAAFDALLSRRRLADQGDIHWPALYERGRIAEMEGDGASAAQLFKQAIEIIELQRASINTEASRIGFVGDKQQVYARAIAQLVAQGRGAEAFDYVERSKSRALVDMLAAKMDFAIQGADTEKTRRVLVELDAANAAARLNDVALREGDGRTRNLKIASEAVRSAAPELSTLVSVSSVPSDELRNRIGADETLVEYYYQGAELYVFILARNGLTVTTLAGTGIDKEVQALRRAIGQPGTDEWQAPSRALHDRLWQPIETMVSTRHAIVVAHGALHYLPFGALQAADGTFLIDRIGFRFLPSASVLKFLRPAVTNKDARLLVIGNPDLGDPGLDLQFAESEARLIADINRGSRLLTRKEASETNFKKTAGVFSRLHFATHGEFRAEAPLDSRLHLAKDAENDGLLTVGELYSMNLDADLATLSACETGLGKIANGDDVVGLTRGFLYAGSRSIVASLWSVDDRATAALMKDFYGNLGRQSKSESLRQAQIATRKNFAHPYFWAAFQLTGRAD